MNVKAESRIDLEEFGGEGEVIMSPPSLRRTINMKNELGKSARIARRNGEVVMEDALQGDLELLGVLVYVEKAPFAANAKSFLAYCDTLEAKDPSAGIRLFDEMTNIAYKLDKGECSPLDNCQPQETPSLD